MKYKIKWSQNFSSYLRENTLHLCLTTKQIIMLKEYSTFVLAKYDSYKYVVPVQHFLMFQPIYTGLQNDNVALLLTRGHSKWHT